MITRARIIDKDLSIGKVKVQIPILQGVGDGGIDTNWASIIYIPGIEIDYQIGDIVEVGFEDNDRGRPIVLGFLKLRDKEAESRAYGTFKELIIEEKLSTPLETTIGRTPYQKLFDGVENLPKISEIPAITVEVSDLQIRAGEQITLTYTATNGSDIYVTYTINGQPDNELTINSGKPITLNSIGTYVFTFIATGTLPQIQSVTVVDPIPKGWQDALNPNGTLKLINANQLDNEVSTVERDKITRISNLYQFLTEEDSHFNCYAYALRRDTPVLGEDDQKQFPIGIFTKDYDPNLKETRDLANQILKDLTSTNPSTGTNPITDPEPLYKKYVQWSIDPPDVSTLADDEYLFAFRVGVNNTTGEVRDYHFIRYDKNIGWTHKMGGSPAVLKLHDDLTPWTATDAAYQVVWPAELCLSDTVPDGDDFELTDDGASTDTMAINPGISYTGKIVYFKYKD